MKSIKKTIGPRFKSWNQHLHKQTKAAYQKWKLCTLETTFFYKRNSASNVLYTRRNSNDDTNFKLNRIFKIKNKITQRKRVFMIIIRHKTSVICH